MTAIIIQFPDGEGQNTITKIDDRLAQLKSHSRDKLRVSFKLNFTRNVFINKLQVPIE